MKIFVIPLLILTLFSVHLSGGAYGLVEEAGYTNAHCLECHDDAAEDHAASVHRVIPCLGCHIRAAVENHEQIAQADCRNCHKSHDERLLHDAHNRVACRACHVAGSIPVIDPESQRIISSGRLPAEGLPPHQAIQPQLKENCRHCHFQQNAVGASTMVLPAKGVLCIPCHVATVSVGDKISLAALFVFILGTAGLGIVWFSARAPRRKGRSGKRTENVFPGGFCILIKTVFIEVVLLKRLYTQSPARWVIHSLIFFPFVFRFAFGLTALLLSILLPDHFVTMAIMDKNHPIRALFFDVTGLMVLAGCMAAIARKGKDQAKRIDSLPKPGPGMPAMIGLIVLVGYILEGMRIAMTGWTHGSEFAFAGYAISLLFKGMTGLNDIYGYVWYAHVLLTGAFVALIPFTRMAHIITTPIVLAANTRIRTKDSFLKTEM